MLANLIVNGFQAMPDGGTLRIGASTHNGNVVIDVADSGAGVDAAAMERAFDPFFTTKASGTGLGLAIVSRIVEAHGGDVAIRNGPTGGAVVHRAPAPGVQLQPGSAVIRRSDDDRPSPPGRP